MSTSLTLSRASLTRTHARTLSLSLAHTQAHFLSQSHRTNALQPPPLPPSRFLFINKDSKGCFGRRWVVQPQPPTKTTFSRRSDSGSAAGAAAAETNTRLRPRQQQDEDEKAVFAGSPSKLSLCRERFVSVLRSQGLSRREKFHHFSLIMSEL